MSLSLISLVALGAGVLAAAAAPPALSAELTPGTYDFVAGASKANLVVKGPLSAIKAEIPLDRGTLSVGPSGKVDAAEAQLDTRKVKTGGGMVGKHVRGRNGLDVENHPYARFVVTGVRQSEDLLRVTGELTMRGISRPLTLSGQIVKANRRRISATLAGEIDRVAFGMTAGRPFYSKTASIRLKVVARKPR